MTAAGHREAPPCRVVERVGQREERGQRLALEVARETVVHLAQHAARRAPRAGRLVQERAHHGHDERRGETLAHHVAADDRQVAVVEVDEVVVVAAHLRHELDARRELEALDHG